MKTVAWLSFWLVAAIWGSSFLLIRVDPGFLSALIRRLVSPLEVLSEEFAVGV